MRLDRKAALGMPVRLTAVFLVLSLSIPLIANSMENTKTDMAAIELDNEISRIVDAASIVYFSGKGASKTVSVDVPEGCEIALGYESGDEYRIKGYRNGSKIAEVCLESPAFPIIGGLLLSGNCDVVLKNVDVYGGGHGVEVRCP